MQKQLLVLMIAAGFALAGCGGGSSGASGGGASLTSSSGSGTSSGGTTGSSGSGSGTDSSGSGGSGSGGSGGSGGGSAAKETVLYSFGPNGSGDGAAPVGRLVMDGAGDLFGVTNTGGQNGTGSVFKISSSGTESILHSFASASAVGSTDGSRPNGSLWIDAQGDLFGTTPGGGTATNGTAFEINPAGTESILYDFSNPSDGTQPVGSLIQDASGNLYGSTLSGGANGDGVVYSLSPGGQITVLHVFAGRPADGSQSSATLVRDAAGNLYGVTSAGGSSDQGTVYEITAAGTEAVLHSFSGAPTDGAAPTGALIIDSSGNLYGTTQFGGANDTGTVFKISATGTESVLYSFGPAGTSDGTTPTGRLVMDTSGNLFGTTYSGGGASNSGTVFELSPSDQETVLHAFGSTSGDGIEPNGALIMDASGNLYGVTKSGGANNTGTVFEITP